MTMAIAAQSIAMHQTELMQAVNVALMREAMSLQESQVAELIQEIPQAAPAPHAGQLDILA